MKRPALLIATAGALLVASMTVVSPLDAAPGALGGMQRGSPGAKLGGVKQGGTQKGAKAESYLVVQIGDELKVIPKSQLGKEKKDAADAYKRDLKEYQDAKKEAAKSKGKSDAKTKGGRLNDTTTISKPPVRQKYNVVVKSTSFKTQEEANEALEKLEKERTKSGSKRSTAFSGK